MGRGEGCMHVCVWRDEWGGGSGCVTVCIVHVYICSKSRNSMSAQAGMNGMVLWETSEMSAQARGLLFVFHLQRKTLGARNQN